MATNAVSYFPLSQLHQEIDDTLVGAVRFNAEQELTDSQKAQARENIGAVPFGSNLKILGHFNTVAELQASAPQNVGDAYSVGAATPYNLYIFDGLRNEWLNYGQIRAADISSRYVENQVIAVSAWTADTTTLAGFNYKAQITISGATGDDFPIVAFNQSDAVSGNFAALAFASNGHIEIFAKTKPTAAVTIPIATLIVNGGNGRGITNATGGTAAGSIKTADLEDGAVTAAKIGAGVVTRAKLANDALFSPNVHLGASNAAFSLSPGFVGKTLITNNSGEDFVITVPADTNIPTGFEVAILRFSCKSTKIAFAGDAKVLVYGNVSPLTAPTFNLETYAMVALKKISTSNYWLLTGPAEVVT